MVLCLGVYHVSGHCVYVINWKAESAVYVISLAAQGLSQLGICSGLMGLRAMQFEPNFYWVAPAEIDLAL